MGIWKKKKKKEKKSLKTLKTHYEKLGENCIEVQGKKVGELHETHQPIYVKGRKILKIKKSRKIGSNFFYLWIEGYGGSGGREE